MNRLMFSRSPSVGVRLYQVRRDGFRVVQRRAQTRAAAAKRSDI